MPLNPHASVGHNINEFKTGSTYAHTEDKFGKDRADKQAQAVALHTHDKGEDHKAAISKMHPEHVHKLVKAAHEGKFGPEAQQMAQSAQQGAGDGQQPPQDGSQPPQDQQQEQQRGRTLGSQHIFGRKPAYQPGQSDDDQDDQQPQMGAANIFGR